MIKKNNGCTCIFVLASIQYDWNNHIKKIKELRFFQIAFHPGNSLLKLFWVQEVFISKLIRYARACRNYSDFLYRARLLEQSYVATRKKSSLQKFYGRLHELVDRYGVSICAMRTDLIRVIVFLSSFVYPGLAFQANKVIKIIHTN